MKLIIKSETTRHLVSKNIALHFTMVTYNGPNDGII